MRTSTLAKVAIVVVPVAAGAATMISPDKLIPWIVLLSGLAILAGCTVWWFFTNFKIVKRQSADAERTEFCNEVVRINDLVRAETSLLAGYRFTRCIIKGPAFLKAQADCRFELIGSAAGRDQNATVVPEGRPILGAILMSRVTFTECYFDRVALIGTAEDARQLLPAFHQEARDTWERRVGLAAV